MKLEVAREKLEREVPCIDIKPFSHNIVRLILSSVAKDEGFDAANSLIDEFKLEEKGWKKVVKKEK